MKLSRASRPPTTQELEIMKILWERESATVRDVYETLRKRRRIAYTTVMTLMKILHEKGHLKRRLADRAYVYEPAKPRKAVVGGMVREFLERVFNGSAEPLLVHLVEDERLTAADLEDLARTIRKKGS
jgi:BlaI family penicillinase repressor